jgi:hypothetical protein
MAIYLNAPNSGVKSYSEGADPNTGKPDSITAYFKTGAYTYTRASVGDVNFENMINLAHDGVGLCRYITRNCRFSYVSKVAGKLSARGAATGQSSARLGGYWSGRTIPHGNSYNLETPTVRAKGLLRQLQGTTPRGIIRAIRNPVQSPLPSGVVRTRRGAQGSPIEQVINRPRPRIKLRASVANRVKPRIKLKARS